MLPTKRAPASPGEILLEEYLRPMKMTQTEFAKKLGVPIATVNQIITERRAITPRTAILLAKALDTSPQLWMNLQTNHDLWHAQQQPRVSR